MPEPGVRIAEVSEVINEMNDLLPRYSVEVVARFTEVARSPWLRLGTCLDHKLLI